MSSGGMDIGTIVVNRRNNAGLAGMMVCTKVD